MTLLPRMPVSYYHPTYFYKMKLTLTITAIIITFGVLGYSLVSLLILWGII